MQIDNTKKPVKKMTPSQLIELRNNICNDDNSNFLSVAHQIQSPLSAVKWTLSMLFNGDAGNLSPEQKDLLRKAIDSNNRAVKLVQDVLSANRLESRTESLSYTLTPILDVVNNSINELSDVAQKRNIKIKVKEYKGESPIINIDREKIRDAFENLLDNAIKYTSDGGTVIVSISDEIEEILISVEDTGIGIEEKDETNIFKKFYRGDHAESNGIKGTGLGLYITKKIIETHGGKIWFEDKKRDLHLEEGGAKFSFTLPKKK